MIVTSARLKATVGRSHTVATLAQVTDPNGTVLATLQPLAGKVVGNTTSVIRRTCNVSVTDPTGTLTAQAAGDLLTPYGNELRLYRGLRFDDGTTELCPLGVFGLVKYGIDADNTGSILISVDGQDRARKIGRSAFTDVYVIAAGTNAAVAIQALIGSRISGLTFSFALTAEVLPLTMFDIGQDPWAKATTLAAGLGMELFFDGSGTCVLQPVPNPLTSPVAWTFADGPTGLASKWTRSFDDSSFNSVVVTGENPNLTTLVTATASDTDPTSATWIGGKYGIITRFVTDRTITTTVGAQARATAELNLTIGRSEALDGNTVVIPFLEPGDVVQISSTRTGISGRYVLDGVSIPMSATDTMSITGRRRTA